MLFQHSGDCQLEIDSDNFQRTVSQLNQSNFLPYHTRTRYLTDRIQKLTGYAKEHIQSRTFVRSLITGCEQSASQRSDSQIQKAA
jgi:putative IMPACT (imprinted ancient) family translation regulator